MYETFYGFSEKPFNLTPDPKYLFLSKRHQEAFAHLVYGIQEGGGFVVITGEIGTGKTILCRYLLSQLDPSVEAAFIFNPTLSDLELLKSINDDFGIPSTGQTKKELIDELNQFLMSKRLEGKNAVLIIDEAQNLDPSVLEQIRLLSNLETEKEKLIQIVLVGQPELRDILARPELKQLSQRVTASYHLLPLDKQETFQYIHHRMKVANKSGGASFEPSALKVIYRHSQGTPRLINLLCDRALLAGFAAGKRRIDATCIRRAILELKGVPMEPWRRWLKEWPIKVFFVSLALLALFYLSYSLSPFLKPSLIGATQPPQEAMAVLDVPPPPSVVKEKPETEPLMDENSFLQRLTALKAREAKWQAARAILALWERDFIVTDGATKRPMPSLFWIARKGAMRCTLLHTNFKHLRNINLPCILELFIPHKSKTRWVVLAGMDDKTASVILGSEEEVKVSLQVLEDFWLKRAFLFWDDYESIKESLHLGNDSPDVVWLQDCLRYFGFFQGPSTGLFDQATKEATLAFQKANNLLSDGIVGPETKMAMYSLLDDYPTPKLQDKGGEA